MLRKTSSTLSAMLLLVCIAVLTLTFHTPVQAQALPANGNENNCANCHENLYFLHDTGNWFCLREAPMHCVDCHGGDPEAITQETAHLNRAAHPVINDDVSKCQECHPKECDERVAIFDQTAGISQVLVAAPYMPADTVEHAVVSSIPQQAADRFSLFWEVILPAFIASLALAIYLVVRKRHN